MAASIEGRRVVGSESCIVEYFMRISEIIVAFVLSLGVTKMVCASMITL